MKNDDIVIDTPEGFYRILLPHQSKMRVENVGTVAFFFAGMKELNDPNVCSCKKGEKRKKSLESVYTTLGKSMNDEQKKYLFNIFGGALVLMQEGVVVGRLE